MLSLLFCTAALLLSFQTRFCSILSPFASFVSFPTNASAYCRGLEGSLHLFILLHSGHEATMAYEKPPGCWPYSFSPMQYYCDDIDTVPTLVQTSSSITVSNRC